MDKTETADDAREGSETAGDLRRRASRLLASGPRLRALGIERIAAAVGTAARFVLDAGHPVGREAREALPSTTGLSEPMIEWALRSTLGPLHPDALRSIARRRMPPHVERAAAVPVRLAVVVLAGNVFTASIRAVLYPLLAGVPTFAKASSRDDVLPRAFAKALTQADAEVAASFDVVSFRGDAAAGEDALFADADVVSIYGSDATVSELRAKIAATTQVVAHGHGLGAVFVSAEAVGSQRRLEDLAKRIALDVAAYDQRGCLSPHAIFLERNAHVSGAAMARAVAEIGLAELRDTLPRGALPLEVGAAQIQWRGVAATRGDLFEGDGYATSYEAESPLRLSPGWRNVAVLDCNDASDCAARLVPLGVHLKALGVAGELSVRKALADALPSPLAPRVSPVGTMQTPSLDALADGDSPWLGLTRWIEIE